MASNRSGNQKAVRVFAILALIGGILLLLFGLVGFFGGSALKGESGDVVETAGEITGTASQFVRFGGLMLGVTGLVNILSGVLGLRASNDATKAMPYLVISAISLALGIYSLISSITSGTGVESSSVVALLISAVNTWCAFQVRQEGQQA